MRDRTGPHVACPACAVEPPTCFLCHGDRKVTPERAMVYERVQRPDEPGEDIDLANAKLDEEE